MNKNRLLLVTMILGVFFATSFVLASNAKKVEPIVTNEEVEDIPFIIELNQESPSYNHMIFTW